MDRRIFPSLVKVTTGDGGSKSADRGIAISREGTMKLYAKHLTARLFGQTRMGGLYLYWTFAK